MPFVGKLRGCRSYGLQPWLAEHTSWLLQLEQARAGAAGTVKDQTVVAWHAAFREVAAARTHEFKDVDGGGRVEIGRGITKDGHTVTPKWPSTLV